MSVRYINICYRFQENRCYKEDCKYAHLPSHINKRILLRCSDLNCSCTRIHCNAKDYYDALRKRLINLCETYIKHYNTRQFEYLHMNYVGANIYPFHVKFPQKTSLRSRSNSVTRKRSRTRSRSRSRDRDTRRMKNRSRSRSRSRIIRKKERTPSPERLQKTTEEEEKEKKENTTTIPSLRPQVTDYYADKPYPWYYYPSPSMFPPPLQPMNPPPPNLFAPPGEVPYVPPPPPPPKPYEAQLETIKDNMGASLSKEQLDYLKNLAQKEEFWNEVYQAKAKESNS